MSQANPIVKAGPFTFSDCLYDGDADVLYLSIGKPRPALTWESPEGHLVRLDPSTGQLVGITILAASRKMEAGATQVSIPESAFSQPARKKPVSPIRISRSDLVACYA